MVAAYDRAKDVGTQPWQIHDTKQLISYSEQTYDVDYPLDVMLWPPDGIRVSLLNERYEVVDDLPSSWWCFYQLDGYPYMRFFARRRPDPRERHLFVRLRDRPAVPDPNHPAPHF
jgi:hypothetical protein